MPTIRVDDDVYSWLQKLASPFEDTPNSVLRRVSGLDTAVVEAAAPRVTPVAGAPPTSVVRGSTPGEPTIASERVTAQLLKKRWKVQVRHGLYHRDGTFYENLERFPAALFDPHGYVAFETEEQYRRSPYLRIGQKLNVPGGIAAVPGYVRKA